jgi:hypothetical protein
MRTGASAVPTLLSFAGNEEKASLFGQPIGCPYTAYRRRKITDQLCWRIGNSLSLHGFPLQGMKIKMLADRKSSFFVMFYIQSYFSLCSESLLKWICTYNQAAVPPVPARIAFSGIELTYIKWLPTIPTY